MKGKGGNMKNDMKITVEILSEGDSFWAVMQIKHDFLDGYQIVSKPQSSKGQLKRKTIQFCDALGLEIVWV